MFPKVRRHQKIRFEKFLTGTTVRMADILRQVFNGFILNCFKSSSQQSEFCAYCVEYAQSSLVFLFRTIILQQCRRNERKEWQLLILSCSPSFTLYASWMGSRARRTLAVTEPAFTRQQTDRRTDGACQNATLSRPRPPSPTLHHISWALSRKQNNSW